MNKATQALTTKYEIFADQFGKNKILWFCFNRDAKHIGNSKLDQIMEDLLDESFTNKELGEI